MNYCIYYRYGGIIMNFNGIPKGKEKNRLYEPIAVSVVKPFTGVLKKLVDEAEEKFAKGEIDLIDYEELRKQAKEIETNRNSPNNHENNKI